MTILLARYGDRFWYEGGGWPSSFTQEQVPSPSALKSLCCFVTTHHIYFQLAEIRRVKLSSILCDNSDDIENIQVKILIIMMMTMMIIRNNSNGIKSIIYLLIVISPFPRKNPKKHSLTQHSDSYSILHAFSFIPCCT